MEFYCFADIVYTHNREGGGGEDTLRSYEHIKYVTKVIDEFSNKKTIRINA